MPNTKSAAKAARQAKRRTARNRVTKSKFKKAEKLFLAAVAKGDVESAKTLISKAVAAYGKAAKKGVIKKGKVVRKQSRLQARLNKLAGPKK